MAQINQGITGAFCGKVGPMVGYMWKNRACVRTYRKDINYPNTEGQRRERDWFIGMVRFASRAKAALQLGFKQQAEEFGMTEGNYFINRNKQFFHRVDGIMEVDYDRLTLAEGDAADVLFHDPVFGEGEVIRVDFEKNMLFSRSSGDDAVHIFAYAPDLGEGFLSAAARRRSKRVEFRLPESWAGAVVHLYGFVVDREGRSSRSTYIGAGRVNHYNERGVYIPVNKSWNDFVEMASRVQSDVVHNHVDEHASPSPKHEKHHVIDLFDSGVKTPSE